MEKARSMRIEVMWIRLGDLRGLLKLLHFVR